MTCLGSEQVLGRSGKLKGYEGCKESVGLSSFTVKLLKIDLFRKLHLSPIF